MRRILFLAAFAAALLPAVAGADSPRPLAPRDLSPDVLHSILQKAAGARSVTVVGNSEQIAVQVEGRVPLSPVAEPAAALVPDRFEVLYRLIPDVAGSRGAASGALQPAANGLFVWREVSRSAAFTDGYRTWALGPYGLQQRLNTERFSWEQADADL